MTNRMVAYAEKHLFDILTEAVMPHDLTEEITERAALYALGQLAGEDALRFEKHLDGGCEVCAAELRAFEEIGAQLALTVFEAEPSVHVRESLMSKLAETQQSGRVEALAQQPSPATTLTVYAEEGEWHELSEGVFVKELYTDKKKGVVTSLFKMLPGARAQAHRHLGVEECLVIEGDFHVDDLILGPGDYHRAEEGSVHQHLYSTKGNLLLIISPEKGFEART